MKPTTEAIRRERDLGRMLKDGRPRSEFELRCIERQRKDLLNGQKRGLKWDEQAAQDAIDFFSLLRHWKGEWSNRSLSLEPWQTECVIAPLFGWKREDGTRRFRFGHIETPRKQGKTTLTAGIGLYGLMADGEPGAEVYCAATKRDQAVLLFKDVKHIAGPRIKSHLKILMNAVTYPAQNATLQAVSSDYNTLDGLNVSMGIVDELHAHKTRHLWDVLLTAMGARRQPLLLAITTAGFDRSSICWEQREHVRNIVEGHVENDAFFGFVSTIDEGDDWTDPKIWHKANPNLGISVKEDFLRDACQTAIDSPQAENNFRRKHLNQWTEQSVRWIKMDAWDECVGTSDLPELMGRQCYAGLDLASTRDVNSLVLVFPLDAGRIRVLPFYWVPEKAHDDRGQRDRTQVMNWADKGLIRKTDGDTTDYAMIEEEILRIKERFDLQGLAFDPWGPAGRVMQSLKAQGFPEDKIFEFRQTIGNFAAPTKKLEELVIGRKLEHGGCPVLRWMASNVSVWQDANGNLRPDKGNSSDKIDGIVAAIMGIGLWMLKPQEPPPFSNSGIFVI